MFHVEQIHTAFAFFPGDDPRVFIRFEKRDYFLDLLYALWR